MSLVKKWVYRAMIFRVWVLYWVVYFMFIFADLLFLCLLKHWIMCKAYSCAQCNRNITCWRHRGMSKMAGIFRWLFTMYFIEWNSHSSTDRGCSNYIWVINNFIAYWDVTHIRGLRVMIKRKKILWADWVNIMAAGALAPNGIDWGTISNTLWPGAFTDMD